MPSERSLRSCAPRAASTISRELRGNATTRSGKLEYRASTAQGHVEQSAHRPKLAINPGLPTYGQERLAGASAGPGRAAVPGPATAPAAAKLALGAGVESAADLQTPATLQSLVWNVATNVIVETLAVS